MTTEEYNEMMNSDTCQRTIHLTNDWGKAGTRKCGKRATHKENNGLPICTHHYNQMLKKANAKKYKTFMQKQSNDPLLDMGVTGRGTSDYDNNYKH